MRLVTNAGLFLCLFQVAFFRLITLRARQARVFNTWNHIPGFPPHISIAEMKALGRQILVEYYECNADVINDVDQIEEILIDATKASKASIISHNFHKFSPHGVSGTIVIAESHIAIHTWPEYNYAAVDIFTCGETIDPWIIQEYINEAFQSKNISSMEMKRGLFKVAPGEELLFKPKDAQEITSVYNI